MTVLVINCGSSSVKFSLLREDGQAIIHGLAERLGTAEASGCARLATGQEIDLKLQAGDRQAQALRSILAQIEATGEQVEAVGHRVVHGGSWPNARRIDEPTLARIQQLSELAPLHNPANAAGIEAALKVFTDLPQVAVFDTSFHQQIEPKVHVYALPQRWVDDFQLRRYGFHGTSHELVWQEACKRLALNPQTARGLTAHLGNGCSASAIEGGHSVDTSMGFTPLEGLIMGTRSGSIDPNLLEYLVEHSGQSLREVTHALNHESGLLALSGRSNDMRELEAAAACGDDRAELAIAVFCFRLARELAGLCVALSGPPQCLVFTAGIGEHSVRIRRDTIAQLGFLGLRLDPQSNQNHGADRQGQIQAEGSLPILVISTNEEQAIAQATRTLLRS